MSEYKLYYFNGRGRAEFIRLIFVAAGQKFEDVRFAGEEWPAHKAKSPTGQAPFLEIINGAEVKVLAQSLSIAHYLAKKFNLAGKDEFEQAEIEMYGDQVHDLFLDLGRLRFDSNLESVRAQFKEKLYAETIPKHLKIFESRLAKTASGYFGSTGLTWSDLYLFTILEWIENKDTVLENYKLLKEFDSRIRSDPKIAQWLATRPQSDF